MSTLVFDDAIGGVRVLYVEEGEARARERARGAQLSRAGPGQPLRTDISDGDWRLRIARASKLSSRSGP